MNIKKSKIALTLSGLLFLSVPFSSAFADEDHCEMSATMMSMKSELVGYVKGFKGDDTNKMHQHMNELLMLSEKATDEIPANINAMPEMDHSKMAMKDMPAMDHSKMDMKDMPEMDHSKMDHSKMDMKDMSAMDHSKMDMKDMPAMDHSKMDMKDMPEMDHSKMDHGDMNMNSADHDMASMPTMEGMTNEQHHQHMMHMQSMTGLNDLFKQLDETEDKEEIKVLLGKVKAHSKKNKLFSKDCN
ncbi:hypothetical protein MT391_19225 [Vibrio sp. 1-Bac 57]